MRNRQLNVSLPSGEAVVAKIHHMGGRIIIEIPKFKIKVSSLQKEYKATIRALEKYLEDFILKGMANEDFDPSLRISDDSGGIDKVNIRRETKTDKGQGSSSGLHFGTRRKKSTESVRRRASTSKVDESSYSSSSRKDKDGD